VGDPRHEEVHDPRQGPTGSAAVDGDRLLHGLEMGARPSIELAELLADGPRLHLVMAAGEGGGSLGERVVELLEAALRLLDCPAVGGLLEIALGRSRVPDGAT